MFTDEDNCDTSPCQNGGICVDEHGGHTCLCPNQWTSKNCTSMCNTHIRWLHLSVLRDLSSIVLMNMVAIQIRAYVNGLQTTVQVPIVLTLDKCQRVSLKINYN